MNHCFFKRVGVVFISCCFFTGLMTGFAFAEDFEAASGGGMSKDLQSAGIYAATGTGTQEPEAWANIEMEQAEYVKACSSFKQAVDVCSFIQRNHVELIRAFVINKQPGSAMESLEQGFKNRLWKENDPDRLNDLGYVAELMGLDEKAVASYQYAVDSDPGCIMAALNLSRILY